MQCNVILNKEKMIFQSDFNVPCCLYNGIYKWNKKKFALKFKKEVGKKALSNNVWNSKKKRWTKPATQIGYKALTVR